MSKHTADFRFDNIGQILLDYVCWILHEADKRGIKRLYFLARDGYLLYKMASKICAEQSLSIECKYLYCSRMALRLPSYHLIGEEAYELLTLGSYRPTMRSLLERLQLSSSQRAAVYKALGCPMEQEDSQMNYSEFAVFTQRLKNCPLYRRLVQEKSAQAYPEAVGYLKQEGLLEQDCAAIVDSGWTGTMQRSLRQLLESAGFKGKIVGFYFGIFQFQKREPADGEFCCWYFDPASSVLNKLLFSNNLFECLLSAPHGMTLGYAKEGASYVPVLNPAPAPNMLRLIEFQISSVLDYTQKQSSSINVKSFQPKAARRRSERLVRRLMAWPTQEEAQFYSQFLFCDDVADNHLLSLAALQQLELLHDNYLLLPRIFRKITGQSKRHVNRDLFWPYGTAALAGSWWKRVWYGVNIFTWDYIRLILSNRNNGKP